MKIFVAGGAGYIGSRLAPDLLVHHYDVTVADLMWFGNQLPEGVNVIEKDIFDLNAKDLEGFDQVIFLGGVSNDPMAEFSPSTNFISNAAAPGYLAYISKEAGAKRFIYADSCSVYGYAADQLYSETDPVTCAYPYGISKLQGEFGALQLQDDSFSVICLRQGTVSGYSPRMRFDLIINTMYMTAMTQKKITVNNPSIWRPILAIEDAVMAYIRSIQADSTIGGVFNVASGNFTVGQVADRIWETLSQKFGMKIDMDIKNIEDYRNYKVTTQKAQDVLGAKFNGSIESILTELAENFPGGFDFDQDEFYNIRVFEKLFKDAN
ncbi:MAG: SDR family oxidoreductase [Candidatus Marinimicrobia bacterium]|mgnify:CR=1 FL=1|jgi:nucleoside-diphosphate-sugar epimerase|nr:SDR family oxidoreductase [Candidatus Neomarinimicrobiota bacterium]